MSDSKYAHMRNPKFWEALDQIDEWFKRRAKYGVPETRMVCENGHGYSVYVGGPGDPDVYRGRRALDSRFCEEWHGYTLPDEWETYIALTGHRPTINPK